MPRSKQLWLTLLAWALVSAAFCAVYAQRGTSELTVYVRGVERVVDGGDPYVIEEGLPPYTYPPAMALPIMPILAVPDAARPYAWCAVHAAMIILTFMMLDRIVSSAIPDHRGRRIIAWGIALLVTGRHLLSPLANNSNDLLVLAAITAAVAFSARRREAGAGVFFGMAAALKATPLLFLPVLLLQARWRAAAAMTGALVIASILPDLLTPARETSLARTWVEMTADAARPGKSGGSGVWDPWNPLNQNLAGTIHRITTAPSPWDQDDYPAWPLIEIAEGPRKIMTLAAQGAVVIGVLLGVRLGRRREPVDSLLPLRRLAEAGVVVVGMLLLSPMSSKAHFCVLALPALAVTTDLCAGRRDRAGSSLLGLAAVLSIFTTKGLLGRRIGSQVLAGGTVMWSALLVGLAAARTLAARHWDEEPRP